MNDAGSIAGLISEYAAKGKDSLSEYQAKEILSLSGIPVPDGELVRTIDDALAAASRIGYPVALKISSQGMSHKSDTGGVRTSILSEDGLADAMREIQGANPGIDFLVEQYVPHNYELILGVFRDPVFGPVLLVGLGGIYAEILSERAIFIPPVSPEYFSSRLAGLKASKILAGARGIKPADIGSLHMTAERLLGLTFENPLIREAEINPLVDSPDGWVAVDALVRLSERDEQPSFQKRHDADPAPFFEAGSIAVIGASASPRKAGNIIIKNLLEFGYRGRIYPVTQSGQNVCGLTSYRNIDVLPETPELAVIVIPGAAVADEVERCIQKGIRHAIIASGGFSDRGPEGTAEESAIIRSAKNAGLSILGPNSIGTITPSNGLVTSITTLKRIRPGNISLIGQTGVFASGSAALFAGSGGIGISRIACIGNKADIDEIHILNFYARDGKTGVVAAYLEGTSDGNAFIDAIRSVTTAKPLVFLKGGRTTEGKRATESHTGTMAGNHDVYHAVLERYGVTAVEDFPELLITAKAFSYCTLPAGRRLGVVSITGVGCVLSADASSEYGINLPELKKETMAAIRSVAPQWAPLRNPVDMWSAIEQTGGAEAYRVITGALLSQDDIDALLLIFVLIPESDFDPEEIIVPIVRLHPDKPVLACHLGGTPKIIDSFSSKLEKNKIPVYDSPRLAIQILSHLCRYAEYRKSHEG